MLFNSFPLRPVPEIRPQDLEPLAALVREAVADRTVVFVARVPVRLDAERTLRTDVSRRFWRAIEETITRSGGHWIDIENRGTYADNEFVDFLHSNACGARNVTEQVLNEVRSTTRESR